MANGAKVALAVGAGYLLGRTRRTRIALMLAAAGLTGKFPTKPTDLVAHGLKSLGNSEQVGSLADQLRGELLTAAKAAALAAATSRVDALNDRLQGVASPSGVADTVDQAGAPVRSMAGRGRDLLSGDEDLYDDGDEDRYDEGEEPSGDEDDYEDAEVVDIDEEPESDEEPEDEAEDEPEEPPRTRSRRRTTRQTASRSGRRSAGTGSDDEGTSGPRRRRRASASTKRAPVRRGR
jgi:hypothetical protein